MAFSLLEGEDFLILVVAVKFSLLPAWLSIFQMWDLTTALDLYKQGDKGNCFYHLMGLKNALFVSNEIM